MRKPQGYAVLTEPDKTVVERDTFTCGHCNKIVMVEPMADPTAMGGMCFCCMKLVCPTCVDTGLCDPMEKKLERMESSYEARRSYEP